MSESTTEEKTNGSESRQAKAAAKARTAASDALHAAFKAYQRWQVAECVANDDFVDAGNRETFADWIADELSK